MMHQRITMWFFGLLLGLGVTFPAAAKGVFFTPQSVLQDFFAESERVTFVERNTDDFRETFVKTLGYAPRKAKYAVFVAYTGTHIDGYAVIDDEQGQHLPITFATKFSPEGVVQRTEVMAYRESYGDQIREDRFRKQFVGQDAADVADLKHDVVAIAGATISSKSMTIAVARAIFLVNFVRDQGNH